MIQTRGGGGGTPYIRIIGVIVIFFARHIFLLGPEGAELRVRLCLLLLGPKAPS